MSDFHGDDYLWNPRAAPDAEIVRLERALRTVRSGSANFSFDAAKLPARTVAQATIRRPFVAARFRWPLAAAASLLVLIGALAVSRAVARPWAVVIMHDTAGWIPGIRTRPALTTGEWIVTDSDTRALLNVGALGKAEIGPSSRVRLLRAAVTEHRLELAEGTLRARIWAPPRFFLLQTPSALAVDLGCVYTMHVDRSGSGYLRVDSGEVELVGRRHRALVPAGNTVHVSEATGPGLPYSDRSSPQFINALTSLERNSSDSVTLDVLIREAGPSATITLWHLLSRVDAVHRDVVVQRLAALAPVPQGTDPGAILRLDPSAMEKWKESMDQQWSSERVYFWKQWWRAMWRAPAN